MGCDIGGRQGGERADARDQREGRQAGVDLRQMRVAIVSTYPPSRCGIARFTESLHHSLVTIGPIPVEILRLRTVQDPPGSSIPDPVVMEFDPDDPVGRSRAARRLSMSDIAVIQHEFGVFGADEGASVLDLATSVTAPVVVVLHTVPARPSDRQRFILEGLVDAAAAVVVPSAAARDLLLRSYALPVSRLVVIPHGSPWAPAPVPAPPRRRILTWGLLGPGKGIESAIGAVAELRHLDPPPTYRIVGQLHPNVVRREGTSYRDGLVDLAARLGVSDLVRFDDRYQDERQLWREVANAHLVVLPYDNDEQVCSGVLTEAVSAGRPVVATAFPHAVELLGGGAGLLVDRGDPHGLAEALASLMVDDAAYQRAQSLATRVGAGLRWDEIGRRYASLFAEIASMTPVVA